jgi:hypothetical protein
MSLDGRLNRVTRARSARERAVLAVRAVWAGGNPDPALLDTMPDEQGREYNRLIGLVRGLQRILLPHAIALSGEVEALGLRQTVLTLLATWGSERSVPPNRRLTTHGPGAAWNVLPAVGGEAALADEALSDLDHATRVLAEQIARSLGALWSRLLAVETLVREVEVAFDDDSAVPDELRELLEDSRERLMELFEHAPGLVGACERPEVDEDAVQRLRGDMLGVGGA